MPGYIHTTYTIEIEATYTQVPPPRDWYEYVETPVKTFVQRIKSAIDADATIQANYAPPVVILRDDDEMRFDVNSLLDKTLIVIHDLKQGEIDRTVSAGRHDVPMSATITAYVRKAGGLDDATNEELALLGDETTAAPGAMEMVDDLRALLNNNRLISGTEPYLRFGIRVVSVSSGGLDNDEAPDIVKASIELSGNKWLTVW